MCITFPPIRRNTYISDSYAHRLPPNDPLDWSSNTRELRFNTVGASHQLCKNEALLTLAHYFDCADMVGQCEYILSTQVGWAKKAAQTVWLANSCVFWLEYAERYKMEDWRNDCVSAIAGEASIIIASVEYDRAKQQWSNETLIEIMESVVLINKEPV